MAQIPRSQRFLKKAEAALIAAIEIYNKPDFLYREETFAILATNAWELLFKARLLKEHNNDPKCLCVYERRRDRKGKLSKKLYKRRNRSGNPLSIGLVQAVANLEKSKVSVPEAVKLNLNGLLAVRDNAVHFINAGPLLVKQVLELGTACVANFIRLSKQWFGHDLSKFNLYLMPIGFVSSPKKGQLIVASADEGKVVKHIAALMKAPEISPSDAYHVALTLSLQLKRSAGPDAEKVVISKDPDAVKIDVSEEDIRKSFPWDYAELTDRCRARYKDFKENARYHEERRKYEKDERFCRVRYLDPGNPRSAKKKFFSTAILGELDKAFERS